MHYAYECIGYVCSVCLCIYNYSAMHSHVCISVDLAKHFKILCGTVSPEMKQSLQKLIPQNRTYKSNKAILLKMRKTKQQILFTYIHTYARIYIYILFVYKMQLVFLNVIQLIAPLTILMYKVYRVYTPYACACIVSAFWAELYGFHI